jgi:signal transduction histidine kinase/DNA-binding response OmpR family regulator
MKPRLGYFFWILMLAFGLMILIVTAQVLTKQNINGLKKGNREAVITFTINNRLQELVNLCFELESKISSTGNQTGNNQSLVDSLTMLGYNASVLEQINLNEETTSRFRKLNGFINQQIETSLNFLQLPEVSRQKSIDSLRKMQLADSVYVTALSIQKYLEKDLQATLNNNTGVSTSLTAYIRTLAIIAIAAVLILGTIIINRHLRQVQLISALEQATAAATKSAQIKEQFLANMSHEIRTPLNAIKGFSRLIAQTPLNREQQQYITIINDASGSLLHIVNDILDISKIEAGKLSIETREFDLKKILQNTAYMFLDAAAEKKLVYSQQISDNVPSQLKGDAERLSQILINLISNGIKFTQAGYVNTVVSLKKEEEEKTWIEFRVEDSGTGIPLRKQELIFKRFEQLDTGNDNVVQGTGLGLSIVKNLVELMGGTISVSGDQGKGSVFTVLLPFEKIDKSLPQRDKVITEISPSSYYTGTSVLVVEDNKVNQLLLKHTLASLDITVDIVSNGQEALDAVARKNFDLVLMDIQMPVMNGYDTAGIMRNKLYLQTPVVAMTAYAMPGEKEKCLETGMNDYIAKPVDFSELVKVLDNFLQPKRNQPVKERTANKLQEDFLLQLAGGDKNMARIILQEIRDEIPHAAKKLKILRASNDINELNTICHHMVSTFAPMGNETQVMKKIQQLRNAENKTPNIMLIDGLVHELDNLEKELQQSIDGVN